ncbi:MAG: hypothetical protein Q4D62_01530 [Planctomycetia bacterium]|nr:hypothetical protein [Planctomycetia bacterium]
MSFSWKKLEENAVSDSVSLGGLYALLTQSQQQIADYLLQQEERKSKATGSGGSETAIDSRLFSQALSPVIERLDALGEMLGETLWERFSRLEEQLNRVGNGRESVPSPPSQTSTSVPAASVSGLESAIFGESLMGVPEIAGERQALLQGVLANDVDSRYFAGLLMMFQSSTPEKMVLLLKDLGEAFYRWNAHAPYHCEMFESILAQWAQMLCESVGLPNSVEIVRVGQRFDSSRHSSTSRGVEVTQVHGWVVLRGNGSVYSKALVDVQ